MKEKTILRKIMQLFKMEVKLEQMRLADGVTVIQADSFEPEMEVMIVTADEQMIPLPIGEYELEDGRMLIVTMEGMISEVRDVVVEETEVIEPVEVPIEASKETPKTEPKKVIETSTKEMHFSAEEFEALKAENEELKVKLSEVKPITFNPEPKNEVKLEDLTPLERHRLIKSRMNG